MRVRLIHWLLISLVALGCDFGALAAGARVARVVVDGRDLPLVSLSRNTGLDLGVLSRAVSFHFAADGSHSNQPVRFRYKLEGCDAEWREAESNMRLVVVFFDDNNEWVDETSFMIRQ